jgi:hypothetical protein
VRKCRCKLKNKAGDCSSVVANLEMWVDLRHREEVIVLAPERFQDGRVFIGYLSRESIAGTSLPVSVQVQLK